MSTTAPGAEGPTQPDEIRRDIEETREQLADTVDELTARLDVKGRATDKAHEVRDQAEERVQQVRDQAVGSAADARSWAEQTWRERPQAVVAASAAALAALTVLLLARRRRS